MTLKSSKNYKWEVLGLLWAAYFLNQADRQVFNVVLPLIKADLQLSDMQVGSIATAFNLFYALLVPFGGYIGDRFSKKWVVTFSILFWSVGTMFTGVCNGLIMLIITRSLATGGERLSLALPIIPYWQPTIRRPVQQRCLYIRPLIILVS